MRGSKRFDSLKSDQERLIGINAMKLQSRDIFLYELCEEVETFVLLDELQIPIVVFL